MFSVRDRVRTKMERDILVEVNHPFIVKLHYGESRPVCVINASRSVARLGLMNLLNVSFSLPRSSSKNPSITSIPDRRKALSDSRLPEGRRSVHSSVQRGKTVRVYTQVLFFSSFCVFTHNAHTVHTASSGDVHRGRCEVLPG